MNTRCERERARAVAHPTTMWSEGKLFLAAHTTRLAQRRGDGGMHMQQADDDDDDDGMSYDEKGRENALVASRCRNFNLLRRSFFLLLLERMSSCSIYRVLVEYTFF